jgi:hypothetical protein
VIEVNIHPAGSFDEIVENTKAVYEEAHYSRLSTEKFMLDGRHSGTGGGKTRPVPEGGVIALDALTRPLGGNGLRSMSVPVAREHAAGGLVEIGDVVDVISVVDGGPAYVVTGVEVVGVAAESGGIGAAGGYFVVLAVDSGQALDLASAIDSGSLEVLRSSGAVPIEGRDEP